MVSQFPHPLYLCTGARVSQIKAGELVGWVLLQKLVNKISIFEYESSIIEAYRQMSLSGNHIDTIVRNRILLCTIDASSIELLDTVSDVRLSSNIDKLADGHPYF